MSALPIIERELRIRARRSSTIWLRVIVGLVAGLTAMATLSWAQPGRGTLQPGKALFDTLNGLAFVFCLIEGLRQTADCLSQEKRDGTIGLLFLTDLRGFEVVLGKFVATSLGSFYGLLAVFPVIGISLLVGGVTAGEFWRTQLVLLNTLFLALACGLGVSACYREQIRALLAGFGVVAVITLLPLPLERVLPTSGMPTLSPAVAMHLANDVPYGADPGRFWLSLLAIHALGWALLALSGWKLAITWRDDPILRTPVQTGPADNRPVRAEMPPPHAETMRSLLETKPAEWIARRQRSLRVFVWLAVLLMVFGSIGLLLLLYLIGGSVGSWFFTAVYWMTQLMPLLLLAFVAAHGIAESKRGGALELLLCTPLSPQEIVRGRWLALWEQLQGQILVVGVLVIALGVCPVALDSRFSDLIWFPVLQFVQGGLCLVRAVAVCWLGMYLGLRSRTTLIAVGNTLVYALAVPFVASTVLWLAFRTLAPPVALSPLPGFFWLHQSGEMIFSLVYSLALIYWAQNRLLTRFREIAAAN